MLGAAASQCFNAGSTYPFCVSKSDEPIAACYWLTPLRAISLISLSHSSEKQPRLSVTLPRCSSLKFASTFSCHRPHGTAGDTFLWPGILVQASKGYDGKKGRNSVKQNPKKNQSPWADDDSVSSVSGNPKKGSTVSSELKRKASGRGGPRLPTNRAPRERISKDSGSFSRDSADISQKDKENKVSAETPKERHPISSVESSGSRILVSAAMPVETEIVLQTQEPASTPLWSTFVSSLSGVWRGVGAAFSPITAEMEPIALGDKNEYLYDCRVLSTVEGLKGTSDKNIQRKILWVVGNPSGEQSKQEIKVPIDSKAEDSHLPESKAYYAGKYSGDYNLDAEVLLDKDGEGDILPSKFSCEESIRMHPTGQLAGSVTGRQGRRIPGDLDVKDIHYDDLMEVDVMELEPGLVFFEDGSYSRGPLELLSAEGSSADYASPTFRIEQCLVRGGHTRLRIVHTVAVEESGEEVQLLRVAVYEEEWMGPCHMESISATGGNNLELFSQRKRLLPQELAGSWKVFEVSATAVLPDNAAIKTSNERPSFVYLSMETLKRRLLPDIPVHFVDEDILDMQQVTVLWLPGGITAYVDIKEDGILTIGVGWFSNDGVNIVMERDYSADAKLFEVRCKSEIRGGWAGGRM